jgi:hypothetical protein
VQSADTRIHSRSHSVCTRVGELDVGLRALLRRYGGVVDKNKPHLIVQEQSPDTCGEGGTCYEVCLPSAPPYRHANYVTLPEGRRARLTRERSARSTRDGGPFLRRCISIPQIPQRRATT